MDSWDIRQNILMNQGYAPILGNFDPTKGQQAAAALPDASSTWSSSYPATTATTAPAKSYQYSAPTSTGKRNRYAELMAQYQQAQPFSFTGYPSTYTGGYDVSPYQPYVAPTNRYAEIMAQPVLTRGGGRVGDREGPSAWSQMTPAERAAYYKEHPTEGSFALAGQDVLGWTTLGGLAKAVGKDAWYDSRLEKMGVNPTISLDTQNQLAGNAWQRALDSQSQSAAYQAAIAAANEAGGGFTANPMSSDPQQQAAAIRQAEADSAAQRANEAAAAQASGGGGGGGRGGSSNSNPGDPGRGGGGAHLAKGGYVSMQHLGGPDPEGPDDGYAALKDGEYVINDKAVKKYGIELMQAINSGKISKGKLRGLLEM